jgi:hypothetical protein
MGKFDEDDDEIIDLIKEYERYVRSSPKEVVDFDEWLETKYGGLRKKAYKPNKRYRNSDYD